MVNWEEIQSEWESSAISFKELAEKHEIKDATIRSQKNRGKWQRNAQRKRRVLQRKRKVEELQKAMLMLSVIGATRIRRTLFHNGTLPL